MMGRKRTLEDAQFLSRRLADATRAWRPGDECRSYRGNETTTVLRVDGEIVYLANGDSMHVSKMRRP